jgi:diguanylate cyclase (GGDEF)-like protein
MRSFDRQFGLRMNQSGEVTEILFNGFDDLAIDLHHSTISLMDPVSYDIFYSLLATLEQQGLSRGAKATLANGVTVFLFLVVNQESVTLFGIDVQDDMMELFDDLMAVNNAYSDRMRELYKMVAKTPDEVTLLEEMMAVNNELVNTRRELERKNKELSRLNDELERINYTDDLTRLGNRRKFFHDVYSMVEEAPRRLVMMDFNNFKVVNDTYGHQRGDELLRHFAATLRELHCLDEVTSYRLGGDEFACLLPADIDIDLAAVVEEINESIRSFHPMISIAYGDVVITKETVHPNRPVEQMMHEADLKMYERKVAFHNEHGIPQTRVK